MLGSWKQQCAKYKEANAVNWELEYTAVKSIGNWKSISIHSSS